MEPAAQIPEQLTDHTVLLDNRTAGFLHIRLARVRQGNQVDLLCSDLPGEWTTELIDRNRIDRLEFLKRADVVWLVIDGTETVAPDKRQVCLQRTTMAIGRLGDFLASGQRLVLVVTRLDETVPDDSVVQRDLCRGTPPGLRDRTGGCRIVLEGWRGGARWYRDRKVARTYDRIRPRSRRCLATGRRRWFVQEPTDRLGQKEQRMKAKDSIVMIGAPDSGKTNYLGRLWGALKAENANLRATEQPDDIRYVLDAFTHLLQAVLRREPTRTLTSTTGTARFRSLGSERARRNMPSSSYPTYRANFGQMPCRRMSCRRFGSRTCANQLVRSCLSGSNQASTFLRSIG